MRAAGLGAASVALCCCLLTLPAGGREEAAPAPRPSWERVLDWLRGERDRFADDLETARAALLARAESEDPALAERLAETSVEPVAWGYGLVPAVTPSPPERPVTPRRTTFSLPRLSTRFAASFRDGALLARTAAEDPAAALVPLTEELERLRSQLRLLEKGISYHAHWQRNVASFPAYYARQNELVDRVVEWRAAEEAGETERAAALRREIADRVTRFRAVPGLRVETRERGRRVLPLRLVTDVDDEIFLAELAAAVREAWVDSPAARTRGFAVELSVERIPAGRLYPGGAPARGAKLDVGDHLDRFPAGRPGITTGAKSTHVHRRFVLLGPTALSRRVLAHELSHLLGFGDAYLRGYEGDPAGRLGCELVEWSGLVDDLMSAPGYGRVSEAMVDRLIEAYSEP